MAYGTTREIDLVHEHYPSSDVIGLCLAGRGRIYEFDAFTQEGVPKPRMTVGRARHCDIKLRDPSVSMVHCEIFRQPGGSFTLEDADSTNGTLVNHISVHSVVLAPGMVISVGRIELAVIGEDGAIPITGYTHSSFLRNAAHSYGSTRKAARRVGKSHTTIQRAQNSQGNKKTS